MTEPHRAPAEPNRVLIVEDEPVQQRALTRVFGQAGIDATLASNGHEAFTALESTDYVAIVSDLQMPDMSGFAFYEQLEQQYPNLASRVVFVTGFADDPEAREFLKKTGQPVLAKPYDIDELVETVRRVMNRRV